MTTPTHPAAQPTDARPRPAHASEAARPPARASSPTNLTRAEALWRSAVLSVRALDVDVDVTGAVDARRADFSVRSRLSLTVHRPCQGVWVDFLGAGVASVRIDGALVPPTQRGAGQEGTGQEGTDSSWSWDGARVCLPALAPGEHEVEVSATGLYSNSGQGLHRFRDPVDGAIYLYTHFEPSDARRAWPCMDQPDLKAPFRLSVTHPEGWTVMGNGVPDARETAQEGRGAVRTTMSLTHPLPTYLTALAAGPWHRVTGQWRSCLRPDDAPVPLSWSCRASLADHLDADELLEVTGQGMDLYDSAYAFPYPWGSYDCVLVPEYNIGAMENPGCVTFNEDHYLFRGPATAAQHGARANTILHEMCHMWFGDLVTPRWWEDTWLKESFADHQGTWAQAEATAWPQAWASFALGRKAWAYAEDSRPATTHPIIAQVDDVEAARQTFDGITYAKGAAVLKQLVAYLGQDVFLAAARSWFTQHAFGNGSLDEFLDTLSTASGRDMHAWARAWLRTCGPSVLTDELTHDGVAVTSLVVRQEARDPASGEEVLRPHRLVVGLYSFDDDGVLRRTARLPVVLEGETVRESVVREAVGLPVPDLVTVNDEDLTYAVVRPDAASLACARTSLGRVADPLTRAVWWSMLDNLVRDGMLSAQAFARTVLEQAGDDTQPATLASLLERARVYALRYTRRDRRAEVLQALVGDDAWDALAGAPQGSDAQLVRARAWLGAAAQGGVLPDEQVQVAVDRIRWLVAGGLAGLEVTTDLRWRAVIALASLGALTDDELAQARAADPSSRGIVRAAQAQASRPDAACKREVMDRLLTDTTLSNDHMDALIAGYAVDAHAALTAPLTGRYLEAVEQVWSTRGQELATRVVAGLFPACGEREDLEAVDAWLQAHPQAPAAARRLVLKGRDDLARAVRARVS